MAPEIKNVFLLMKKNSLQLVTASLAGSCCCIKAINRYLLLLLFCLFGFSSFAQVLVTPASGGTTICRNKAVGGIAPAFTTVGSITITEGGVSDFYGGSGGVPATNVVLLSAPAGWQFSGALPAVTYTSGANVTAVSCSITSTTLTVNITTLGSAAYDQVTVTGLQVQATSTSSSSGNIYATSVSGVTGVTTGTGGTNFGSLALVAPVTPSVIIAASPSGTICSGTNVIFTPTPTNGGSAPAYQWTLNGANVSTSTTYANSSLSSGNTIAVSMTSNAACVAPATVTSNTVTMTVNPSPAAISGVSGICPGATTTFTDATSGGTWASSNTAIGSVDGSGNVTGIAAGICNITYTVAGCSAIKPIIVYVAPTRPVVTPSVTAICNGNSATLTATGSYFPDTILVQNFNAGLTTWTVDSAGSVGTVWGAQWKWCGDGYVNEQHTYHSPDNSTFAMSNSDTSGSTTYTSSRLISPVFTLAGYSAATLTFQMAYDYWSGDMNVNVEISTDGGSTWTTMRNYAGADVGTNISFATQTISLTPYLGSSNCKIRFYYYCHWGYYWAIDNVLIMGTSSEATPSWSPVTHLYNDAGFTTPYTSGTQLNTVYVRPTTVLTTTVVTYTATATNSACSSSGTSAVTINPIPAAISGASAVCVASNTTLTNATTGGTWSSSNTGIATIGTSSGVVTGVAAGTTIITYTAPTNCFITQSLTVNPLPTTTTGITNVCVGLTTTLSNSTPAGVWSSGAFSGVATVGTASGIVTGIAAGTALISYTLPTGCRTTTTVTVNPLPPTIGGSSSVCISSSVTLSNTITGGAWTSSAPAVASIGSSSGVVNGLAPGTVSITYTAPTGCIITKTMVVNVLPAPISGVRSVCAGLTTTLSDAGGGMWISGTPTVATIGSISGVVSGLSSGTSVVTYMLGTGCTALATVTVYPLPALITGTTSVCVGLTTSLASASVGGFWSTGNPAIAVAGSVSGIVSGIAAGTTVVTYTLPTGCITTSNLLVNPLPAAVAGADAVCVGLSTTLTNSTSGGLWSSGDLSVATVGSVSGLVNGVAAGSVNITYTLGTGCISIKVFTVHPLPAAISGTTNVCVGLTTTLSNTGGGTWASSNSAIASVGSATGIVAGVAAGTAIVTYTLPTGCIITASVLVNPLPAPITGVAAACEGVSVTLSNITVGGSWYSSDNALATVGSGTGNVTAIAAGTPIITYQLATGCVATRVVTVHPLPSPIGGGPTLCLGYGATLTNLLTGGTWVSGSPAIVSVGSSSGIVSGLAVGTSIITYTLPTGCQNTVVITVNSLPSPITGNFSLCQGIVSTLYNPSGGGTWSSSNTAVAAIGSATGSVLGVTLGTARITYTLGTSCTSFTTVTVSPLPAVIVGPSSLCVGLSATFTDATPGGLWSSIGWGGTADVGSASGIVTGMASGSAVITYTLPTGCSATKPLEINGLPASIDGVPYMCAGFTTTLTCTGGGLWSSGSTAIATVGSVSGVVRGVLAGTSNITYSLGTGCYTIRTVTVNPLPAPISGTPVVCVGSTSTLTSASPGGIWVSMNTAIGDIGSTTGVLTGISAGTTAVVYTLPTGCSGASSVIVNPVPDPISGVTGVCLGLTSSLSNATPGGIWSSSNPFVARIGSVSGMVSGLSAGSAIITYRLSTGCLASTTVVVYATPGAIAGPSGVCIGSTATLSAIGGGTWSSSNTAVADIGSTTGIVTSVAVGTTIITYSLGVSCNSFLTVTVTPLPSLISGPAGICTGAIAYMTNPETGTWSSSAPAIASIDTYTGGVTGITAGTVTITFTLPTGCVTTASLVTYPSPDPITGILSVCQGSTTILYNTSAGGVWNSGNDLIATIDSITGLVNGLGSGTVIMSYTLPTGCMTIAALTVNPRTPITGRLNVCVGLTTALSSTSVGGTWTSSNPAIASIGLTSGIVTGVSAGVVTITYVLPTGCTIANTLAVFPAPAPVTGLAMACVGQTTTLSDATPGGTWSSGDPSIAIVGSTSGVVIGIAGGMADITYTSSIGCPAWVTYTVNPLPLPITGPLRVCLGLTSFATAPSFGGTWSSSAPAIATIGSSSGLMYGVALGTSIITYTFISTGCYTTSPVTVNPPPSPIVGPSSVCVSGLISVTDATPGGSWSSSNTAIAGVGLLSGAVSGVSAGTVTITYTPPTGCVALHALTVNPLPAAITGGSVVCASYPLLLADVSPGGLWTSGSPAIATVGSASGVVLGMSGGGAIITYTLPTGCRAMKSISVLPTAPVVGPEYLCLSQPIIYTNAVAGGTWTSSNIGVATVGSLTGLVTGVTLGSTIISYSLPTGCVRTATVVVSPLPSAIAGPSAVCYGASVLLTDSSTGGSWSSSDPTVATVGSSSGLVSGVSVGETGITYTLPTGCLAYRSMTVNPLPASIVGLGSVCAGQTINLFNASPDGAWLSSDVAIAAVGSTSGVVTGVTAGSATISYVLPTGCYVTHSVAVNALSPIVGPANLCYGVPVTFTDGTPGGRWLSSNSVIAVIGSSTGVATGMVLGTATISYILPSGCVATATVTVYPLPTLETVTGGGSRCASGPGVVIGLASSRTGFIYILKRSGVNLDTLTGTGSSLDYGTYTTGGLYTVLAVNIITGCSRTMSGSAFITVIPDAVPEVRITTGGSDTLCTGVRTTFTALPINGGTAPTYVWNVNGTNVGILNSYSFVPATGDVVTCTMTSNAVCALPSVVSSSDTLYVSPFLTPSVTIDVYPGDTVCAGRVATFTPSPVIGGISPTYMWRKNGVDQGLSPVFVTAPVFGDVINCIMTSSFPCLAINDVASNSIKMKTVAPFSPSVVIEARPGAYILPGQTDTFTAIVSNAGLNPEYQWAINNTTVPGATNSVFITSSLANHDSVSCVVTTTGICNGNQTFNWIIVSVNNVGFDNVYENAGSLSLAPNPNDGNFKLVGTLNTSDPKDVHLTVTDILGRVVFEEDVFVNNRSLNIPISLTPHIKNGIYLLQVQFGDKRKIMHFVVGR